MKQTIWIMATIAVLAAGCARQQEDITKAPITKPDITIEGGRLTPEGLWAMGRIGCAVADIETVALHKT